MQSLQTNLGGKPTLLNNPCAMKIETIYLASSLDSWTRNCYWIKAIEESNEAEE
jgi:hypothetical protein